MRATSVGGMVHTTTRAVTRDALAIGVGTAVFGLSFGALAVTAGFSPLQAQTLSLLMFTGGSQYALVGVVAGGGDMLAALSVAWLLGARNTLYAVRLTPLVRLRGARGSFEAQLVIDETAAMATSFDDPRLARHAFLVTGAAVYILWNLGTLIGVLAVTVVPDPRLLGLDVAFPAAFLALLVPRLRSDRRGLAVALLGGAVAVALTPVAPPGVPVLAAVAGVVPTLFAGRVVDQPRDAT